jgi:bleomycin hydrolase
MKQFLIAGFVLLTSLASYSQGKTVINTIPDDFTILNRNAVTPVKSQGMTGTCWAFSTTALLESETMKNKLDSLDLSEMFTVRNIYIEKARNYLLRQGNARFDEGSLGHDVIRAVATYGAVPEQAYSGIKTGSGHNHSGLVKELKAYLDSLLRNKPIESNWQMGYEAILDNRLGAVPASFTYQDKNYTASSFAKEVLKFNADDYVYITSFTHKPYNKSFIIDVPDNFSNGAYYNIPLDDMLQLIRNAVKSGYSIAWDADVSNNGFRQQNGVALFLDSTVTAKQSISATTPEAKWDAATRQKLFENLTTQDDHLMEIVGSSVNKEGKLFFTVKNSWGAVGPLKGFIEVSEAYIAINTIGLVLPKAALGKDLLSKIK